ncbi:MAG: F0F1 ATP synthase subunit delta [Nitrosomonas sp.]|nr:F0F1 ATP synthase subunit delta [Nitrosomonas sp.]
MAEAITIARPYAEAVFRLAKERQNLSSWSEMLNLISSVVSDKQISALLDNPRVPRHKLYEIIVGSCSDGLSEEGKNLVAIMIENKRLQILPQLKILYEHLKTQHENALEAKIISAFPLNSGQQEKLVSALRIKFKRKVDVTCTVDAELIGGVKIEIGDQVIDSSVSGKLAAMTAALKS